MALGDYDDERGRDQMDREHWADLDDSPVRQPHETASLHAARLMLDLWDRAWNRQATVARDEGGEARSRRCHPARDWL